MENFSDFDIVLDTSQGETLSKSIDAVKQNGIIVTLPSPEIPKQLKDKALEIQINLEFMMVASKKETIKAISNLLEIGSIKSHIHKTFSFEENRKSAFRGWNH